MTLLNRELESTQDVRGYSGPAKVCGNCPPIRSRNLRRRCPAAELPSGLRQSGPRRGPGAVLSGPGCSQAGVGRVIHEGGNLLKGLRSLQRLAEMGAGLRPGQQDGIALQVPEKGDAAPADLALDAPVALHVGEG